MSEKKLVTYLISLVIILLSCQHNNTDFPTANNAEISFDFDGVLYSYKTNTSCYSCQGTYAEKRLDLGGIGFYYAFYGVSNSSDNIVILIPTDSLKTIIYHHIHQNGDAFTINSKLYSVLTNADYLDIKITGYNNQVVNGTFQGKISRITNSSPYSTEQGIITNGEFKNIKINYNY